jgi:hypothetical protein
MIFSKVKLQEMKISESLICAIGVSMNSTIFKRVIFSFLLVFFMLSLNAQNLNIAGAFPTIDHSAKLSKKFSYNVYVFSANSLYNWDNNEHSKSLYVYGEAGLSYSPIKSLTFTNSYVYERQNPFELYFRNEHRIFQQVTHHSQFGNFKLKNRVRFDERFIQNRTTQKFEFSHRLRYLVGTEFPISDRNYILAYSEQFFNTVKHKQRRYNENWSALQLGFKLNNNNYIEAGYLFVSWRYNENGNWFNQHYLQTTWVNKLDFRKK